VGRVRVYERRGGWIRQGDPSLWTHLLDRAIQYYSRLARIREEMTTSTYHCSSRYLFSGLNLQALIPRQVVSGKDWTWFSTAYRYEKKLHHWPSDRSSVRMKTVLHTGSCRTVINVKPEVKPVRFSKDSWVTYVCGTRDECMGRTMLVCKFRSKWQFA
jgi:hypothetical protein